MLESSATELLSSETLDEAALGTYFEKIEHPRGRWTESGLLRIS